MAGPARWGADVVPRLPGSDARPHFTPGWGWRAGSRGAGAAPAGCGVLCTGGQQLRTAVCPTASPLPARGAHSTCPSWFGERGPGAVAGSCSPGAGVAGTGRLRWARTGLSQRGPACPGARLRVLLRSGPVTPSPRCPGGRDPAGDEIKPQAPRHLLICSVYQGLGFW